MLQGQSLQTRAVPRWAPEVSKGRTGLRPQSMGRGEGMSSCSLSAGSLGSLPRVKPVFATVPPSLSIRLSGQRQPNSPCAWGLPGQDGAGAGFCPSQYLGPELPETQGTKAPDTQGSGEASGVTQVNPSMQPAERWPRRLVRP